MKLIFEVYYLYKVLRVKKELKADPVKHFKLHEACVKEKHNIKIT